MPVSSALPPLVAALNTQFFQQQEPVDQSAMVLGKALGELSQEEFEASCQYAFDVLGHPAGALSAFQAHLRSPQLPPLLVSLITSLANAHFDNRLGKALETAQGLSAEGFRTVVNRPASHAEVDSKVETLCQALEDRALSPDAFVDHVTPVLGELAYANASIKRAHQALTHHYQDAIAQAAGPHLAPHLSISTHEMSTQALRWLMEGMQQAFEKDPALRTPKRLVAFSVIFTGLTDTEQKHSPYSPTTPTTGPRLRRRP